MLTRSHHGTLLTPSRYYLLRSVLILCCIYIPVFQIVFSSLQFLDAFAKFLKATISFVMSVRPSIRPSVRMEQLGCLWTDVHKIWYGSIFRKPGEKDQVSLKSDKNKGCLTRGPVYIIDHTSLSSLRMKNVSEKKSCIENQNKQFMLNYFFFFLENRAFYEVMWTNFVERGRPQMTIWRMCIACWILKSTNTHSGFVQYLLLFHCNNGCKNAPQYCILLILPALFCPVCYISALIWLWLVYVCWFVRLIS